MSPSPDERLAEWAAERDLAASVKPPVSEDTTRGAVIVAILIVLGGCFLWLGRTGKTASTSSSGSTFVAPAVPAATSSNAGTSYADQLRRHRELGQKTHPSHGELKEYLILDSRLGVQEGQMSKEAFEQWTGEKY